MKEEFKILSEKREGYCPNEDCEFFNEYQGDYGQEESKVVRCVCGTKLVGSKLK